MKLLSAIHYLYGLWSLAVKLENLKYLWTVTLSTLATEDGFFSFLHTCIVLINIPFEIWSRTSIRSSADFCIVISNI